MTTTVEEVRRHLQRDPALADVLIRGIANLRRTARWMLAEYDWDATEEAVVSGLRRYAEKHTVPPLWADREQLQTTSAGLRTGLALLSIDRSFELHEAMQGVWSAIGPFDCTAVLPGRRHLRLVVDRFDLDEVRDALPMGSVDEIVAPLSAVELHLPRSEHVGCDLGVMAHVVGVLVQQGVAIQDIATCQPECLLFVPEDQAIEAYERANHLVEQPKAVDARGA